MNTAPTKSPVLLYTEQTPNPETLKFVTNRMLYKGTADFRTEELAKEWSPLAEKLFEFPYVKGVYISNNYVTLTKEFNYQWDDIMLKTKEFIKQYVGDEGKVINEGFEAYLAEREAEVTDSYQYTGEEKELVDKIKSLIDTHVKPAVEMDGGNIEFKSFENGIVTVIMQGDRKSVV